MYPDYMTTTLSKSASRLHGQHTCYSLQSNTNNRLRIKKVCVINKHNN